MRLVRFGDPGHELPGVLLADGRIIDVSGEFEDFDESFFACGGIESLRELYEVGFPKSIEVEENLRLGPPVARPSKIVCVGKNYKDHSAEFGGDQPTEPPLFLKATTAYNGPNDDVIIPQNSLKTDYEVELAIVIGRTASDILESESGLHIAGYTLLCDYSERDFQLNMGGQWTKGKSADTFAPVGPCLVTPDEIENPQNLRLWLAVNGTIRQNGYTGDMVWNASFLVSYISRFMTLLPGDVVATGTPAGVGMGLNPPVYLKPGDVVELGCDEIGVCKQRLIKSVKSPD